MKSWQPFGVVVEAAFGLPHDPLNLLFLLVGRLAEEIHRAVDTPAQATGVKNIEAEAVAAVALDIEGLDRVVQAAGVVGDGERAVLRSDHLWQPAGLEGRRHQDEVRRGVADVGQAFVEVADRDAVVQAVHLDDLVEVALVGAAGDDRDLEQLVIVGLDDFVEDVGEELAALRRCG